MTGIPVPLQQRFTEALEQPCDRTGWAVVINEAVRDNKTV